MSIRIKPAAIRDAPAILALQKKAYESEARIYSTIILPPMVQTLEEMEEEIRTMTVLKALEGHSIVGSVRAEEKNRLCRIGRLIVAPDFQGRGIGTRLMDAVETAFPAADAYELFTGEKSLKNIRLYQRLGYARARTREVSPGLTLVFLQKKRHP